MFLMKDLTKENLAIMKLFLIEKIKM